MAVVFDYDTMREIDRSKYLEARNRLYQKYDAMLCEGNFDYSERSRLCDRMENITDPYNVCYQFVNAEIAEYFAQYGVRANKGTKVSRVLGKFFRDIGLDKVDGYNHDYAQLSDALNPLKITRFSLLSVHPCDYLHMSYGTGWQSCHNIDSGDYMGGTLSYMGDTGSMIFYTIDKGYSGEGRYFWREAKINRQVYSYSENMLLQSRLYPNCEDADNHMNFRNAVQKIMADALGVPNYWRVISTWDEMNEHGLSTHEHGLHYEDYYYDDFHANLSILKGAEHGTLIVGSAAYCIDCGKLITDDGILNCCGRYRCAQCGEYVSRYNCAFIDDKPYCPQCVERCQICGKYHVKGTLVEAERNGNTLYVCESCVKDYCVRCAVCGKLYQNERDGVRRYGNEHICISCVDQIVLTSRTKGAAYEVA